MLIIKENIITIRMGDASDIQHEREGTRMEIKPQLDYSRFEACIKAVDTHTVGEFTRVVYAGTPEPEGRTMIEKRQWMESHCDHLRTALMLEPRGHHDTMGAVLCRPVHEECAYGVIFIDTGGFLNMCGHGTIGVATMLVECGLVEVKEPYTDIALDMPAGVIRARVKVEQGRAQEVSLVNVPAFLYKDNVRVTVDGQEINLTISFGGSFFALVDTVKELGIARIEQSNVKYLMDLGQKIRDEVNRTIEIRHPELDINEVDLVEFYGPTPNPDKANMRNVVIFGDGQADRSPCGTGTSAKMATLHAWGELPLNQEFVYESIIETLFRGMLLEETKVGEFDAVIPRITGSAYITGQAAYLIDERDPLKYGFAVG